MCLSTPKIEAQAPTPPPAQNTQALASPYEEDLASNLSQLRMGSKANLAKARKAAGGAPSAPAGEGPSAAPAGPGPVPSGLRLPSYKRAGVEP